MTAAFAVKFNINNKFEYWTYPCTNAYPIPDCYIGIESALITLLKAQFILVDRRKDRKSNLISTLSAKGRG